MLLRGSALHVEAVTDAGPCRHANSSRSGQTVNHASFYAEEELLHVKVHARRQNLTPLQDCGISVEGAQQMVASLRLFCLCVEAMP